jgi:THO complex subunit 2
LQYELNQKLGLCEALISLGAWEQAALVLQRLPPFFAVCHEPIARALCQLVSYVIDPLYAQ